VVVSTVRELDLGMASNETQAALLEAVRTGDLGGVRTLLTQHADPGVLDEHGSTSLHLAAQRGYVEMISVILDAERAAPLAVPAALDGENIALSYTTTISTLGSLRNQLEALDKYSCTPLHHTTHYKQLEAARALLAAGANILAKSSTGCTPLHFAANNGTVELTSLLVASGAKVDARDNDDWTPLHYAACTASPVILEFLLDAGADVNACDKQNRAPLDLSVSKGKVENTRHLLNCGAVGGHTRAVVIRDISPVGTVEAVKEVLKAGLDLTNSSILSTASFLSPAAKYRQEAYIASLLAAGADMYDTFCKEVRDPWGFTVENPFT
jgi:ankyrin repeat protein